MVCMDSCMEIFFGMHEAGVEDIHYLNIESNSLGVTFMSFGECSVFLLSEYMYEYVKPRGALKPLADALGEVPEKAHDEYSIYLKDTPYYALEPALQMLPEDTLVCIAAPYDFGNSADPEFYGRSLAMLRAIVLGE